MDVLSNLFTQSTPVAQQVEAAGRYLQDAGFKPGMGMADLYSANAAGRVGRYNASDAANGGAPGTVLDKVNNQMGAHRKKAASLLGEAFANPPAAFAPATPGGQAPQAGTALAQALPGATLPTFNPGPDASLIAAALAPPVPDLEPRKRQQVPVEEQARRRALLSIGAAFGGHR